MIDWVRLGQAVLVQACQDATRQDEIGQWARDWLTEPENGLRDSILFSTTPYSQDDLNNLAAKHEPTTAR